MRVRLAVQDKRRWRCPADKSRRGSIRLASAAGQRDKDGNDVRRRTSRNHWNSIYISGIPGPNALSRLVNIAEPVVGPSWAEIGEIRHIGLAGVAVAIGKREING